MSLLAQHAAMLNSDSSGADTWGGVVSALPGIWGWWKLDEVAGSSVGAIDSSGNGRHGAFRAAGSQTDGLFAGSVTAQESLGNRISLQSFTTGATPAFTLGAFIRTTASGAGEQQILSADPGVAERLWQFRKSPTTQGIEFITIQPAVTTTTGPTAINDGDSHLAIVTFDQSLDAGDGRIKLYVDGGLDAQSSTAITIVNASRILAIGARSDSGATGLWSGAIDECFICNGAISAADVAALWAARNS